MKSAATQRESHGEISAKRCGGSSGKWRNGGYYQLIGVWLSALALVSAAYQSMPAAS
jgi:hypothetical protein